MKAELLLELGANAVALNLLQQRIQGRVIGVEELRALIVSHFILVALLLALGLGKRGPSSMLGRDTMLFLVLLQIILDIQQPMTQKVICFPVQLRLEPQVFPTRQLQELTRKLITAELLILQFQNTTPMVQSLSIVHI